MNQCQCKNRTGLQFYQSDQMSQINLTPQQISNQNQSIHLPRNNKDRAKLNQHLDQYINELKQVEGNSDKIDLLNQRKKLISKHGLSVERIDNLQCIFLHYCSHIFKTGKHMTFERLEYEKSHMTMDRYFVFLKDFGLTSAAIDGVTRQIFDKNQLILIFKKTSVNCKDLNFQQFISSLQRIAILYFDAKVNYKQKQQRIARDRKKRKDHYLKSLQKKKAAMQAHNKLIQNGEEEQDDENEEKLTSHEDVQSPEIQKPQEHQNDKLVAEMINDKNIEDPEAQMKGQGSQKEHFEGQVEGQSDIPLQASRAEQIKEPQDVKEEQLDKVSVTSDFNREELLQLSLQEKIQFFYELINVDNAASFKKKMRELNLPLFQSKHRRATSHADHIESSVREVRQTKFSSPSFEQQQRLESFRMVIEQRRERDKNNSPKVSKDYQQHRQKRKATQNEVVAKKFPKKRKLEVNDIQTDLSSLSKMEFDKINFRKFNPQNLYQASEEDDYYLEEYGSNKKAKRSEKRILSSLDASDKNSQILLQKLKKRAQQLQARERLQESKYQVTQDINAAPEHQIRKNRLVQKLLKMQRR